MSYLSRYQFTFTLGLLLCLTDRRSLHILPQPLRPSVRSALGIRLHRRAIRLLQDKRRESLDLDVRLDLLLLHHGHENCLALYGDGAFLAEVLEDRLDILAVRAPVGVVHGEGVCTSLKALKPLGQTDDKKNGNKESRRDQNPGRRELHSS